MIRHIVLFKLRGDEAERRDAAARLKAELESLVGTVPGLASLRVDADGSGIAAHWHVALVSEHESWDALAGYQSHPDHLRIVQGLVAEVAEDKVAVDYAL